MLVANHGSTVKYYTNAGVTVAEKITLRCTRCSLFYNYAQYGNKCVRGFCHYPAEQGIPTLSTPFGPKFVHLHQFTPVTIQDVSVKFVG